MRILRLGCAIVALHVLGCGSPSSSSNLYAGGGQCRAGTCPPPGTGGVVAAGGAGGLGAGGIIALGGSGGAAGFENTGGDFSTGGFSFFTGGFGGLLDGSIASGGEGGTASTCPSGHYSGSFTGTYGIIAQVSGTIEFTIDPSGTVTGTYTGTNPNNNSHADLVGTFDCTTLELAMRIENGQYPGTFGLPVRFSGTMPGIYSTHSLTFSGTWTISDSSSQSGNGTWFTD